VSAEVNQQLSKALRRSIGINNVMEYRANFQFVQHVLEMDTTFPGNPLLWRSLRWGPLQHAAYLMQRYARQGQTQGPIA
jgi:predicted small integral membrane protein